ncbi:MAG: hypothetical protein BWY07_02762 [Candidatus Hydrogenedentes bacterium ADurb.Bin170]|nr:MAG: hypothetical protein BWY07_02762 [Candidatus Hydrogenedentes bacterium ADurb.Bin170]
MARIGSGRSGTQITAFTDNAVANIIPVRCKNAIEKDGVFNFRSLADSAAVADGCAGSDPAVGTDYAVLSDKSRSVNNDTCTDTCAFADVYFAVHLCQRADFALPAVLQKVIQPVAVCFQQMPGIADGKIISPGMDHPEYIFQRPFMNCIGHFNFAAGRGCDLFQKPENIRREGISADIGEI